MITCTFNGRLGNNLFQIATAISLAKRLNTEFVLPVTTWAGHRGYRNVDLSMFNYDFVRTTIELEHSYGELDFHYNTIPLQDNMQISGFYQSWKYFDDIRNDLLTVYFSPAKHVQNNLLKYDISNNSLGISVRRGDYLMLQQNHCVLSTDYYQTAINKYFQNNIDSIYIFSDDIEWCRSVFGNDVIYVQDDIGTQLFLMAQMKHLILSNSTFAWWGAYLNIKDGLVITPDPWFGPAYSDKNTKDLFYPSWIKHTHDIVTHSYNITSNMIN